jgi:dCTP deaminase
MILSKKELLDYIKEDKLSFEPNIDSFQVQPDSLDLRLGWNFYIPKNWELNEKGRVVMSIDYLDNQAQRENYTIIKLKPGQYFEILPKEFILASTLEKISLNDDKLMAILYARSSFIRRGLLVLSGVVDVKYSGYLTLPIVNNTENQIIRLYPGERICQLVFEDLSSGISEEEAQKHGVIGAKYLKSAPYALESKSDSDEEVEFIKSGNLEQLKEKFKA